MFGKFVSGTAVVAGLLVGATSAEAAIIKATYVGTVSSGYDHTNTFGTPTSDLAGSSFKIVYTIDDTLGEDLFFVPGVGSARGGGWSDTPPSTSPVSADVTINGITIHIDGAYGGSVSQSAVLNWIADITMEVDLLDSTHVLQTSAFSQIYPNSLGYPVSWDYHTPFSHSVQPGDIASTHADWTVTDVVSGIASSWSADMAVESVSITGIPEPATLAVFGLGLLGTARLRRRLIARS